MHLNTEKSAPLGKPCIRDYAQLISPKGLLPEAVVPLLSMKQLRRRANEISATHPQFREELPVVLTNEAKRRRKHKGKLQVTVNHLKVA